MVILRGFPGGSGGKESTCSVGEPRDVGLIPESGRFHGEGHGKPLQYSCLENPMDRAWWATIHGPRDLPDPGMETVSLSLPELVGGFFTTEPPEKLTGA